MKKFLLSTLLVSTVIVLSACGGINQENEQIEKDPVEITQEDTNKESEKNDEVQQEDSDTKTAIGAYTGQIDSNTIEINVENTPKVFVITDVADEIDILNENDIVRVKYLENEYGQLILKGIEKVK